MKLLSLKSLSGNQPRSVGDQLSTVALSAAIYGAVALLDTPQPSVVAAKADTFLAACVTNKDSAPNKWGSVYASCDAKDPAKTSITIRESYPPRNAVMHPRWEQSVDMTWSYDKGQITKAVLAISDSANNNYITITSTNPALPISEKALRDAGIDRQTGASIQTLMKANPKSGSAEVARIVNAEQLLRENMSSMKYAANSRRVLSFH